MWLHQFISANISFNSAQTCIFWFLCAFVTHMRMFVSPNIRKKYTFALVFLIIWFFLKHIRKYSCAYIIYKAANMCEYLSTMSLRRMCTSVKVTYTYPLRTCLCCQGKTCTFSENASVFRSYFCEQLCTRTQRCAFVCMRDNVIGIKPQSLYFIEVYVLLACTYERLVTYA